MFIGGVPVAALGTQSFRGVLDQLSVLPAAAYGLRRLRRGYTGPAINVRRSTDNAAMDIGFLSNGNLDTGTLLAFVGSGSGYVTTWYDQSGFGRNLTQATASTQPIIVSSGSVVTQNNKPAIYFNRYLLSTSAFSCGVSSFSANIVATNTITTYNSNRLFIIQSPSDANEYSTLTSLIALYASSNTAVNATRNGGVTASSPYSTLFVATTYCDGSNLRLLCNNGAPVSAPTSGALGATVQILLGWDRAMSNNSFWTGYIGEAIWYHVNPSVQDQQIRDRNQGSFFGISVA